MKIEKLEIDHINGNYITVQQRLNQVIEALNSITVEKIREPEGKQVSNLVEEKREETKPCIFCDNSFPNPHLDYSCNHRKEEPKPCRGCEIYAIKNDLGYLPNICVGYCKEYCATCNAEDHEERCDVKHTCGKEEPKPEYIDLTPTFTDKDCVVAPKQEEPKSTLKEKILSIILPKGANKEVWSIQSEMIISLFKDTLLKEMEKGEWEITSLEDIKEIIKTL